MKAKQSRLRALDRSIPWRSGAHRFWYWACTACLALYLAYAAYLSRSGLFVSAADTLGALLGFAAAACLGFALLVWVSGLKGGPRAPAERKRLKPAAFAAGTFLSLAILAAFLAADQPGGVTVDSAVQWTQACTGSYSNWHPVFHTLLLRLCALLSPNYALAVAVQCAVFSVAAGYLVATLHAWGAKLWALLAVEALAVASPIVGNTMMYLWKDNAMTIGVTVLGAQVVNLYFSRGGWLGRARNALAFGLALAFTTLVRHNALLFTLPLAATAFITCRRQLRGALTAMAALAAALALVLGPLYSALNVSYPSNGLEESIGVPMTVLCNIRKENPNALNAEARAMTDAMADDEGWAAYATDVYNSIKFGPTRRVVAGMTLSQILRITAGAALADPRDAFLAVNGVTDLVWGLDDEGAANVRVRNSGDLPAVQKSSGRLNAAGSAVKALITAPLRLNALSWYFGNIGASFLLMLALSLRALRRNGTRALLICLPTLLYNLGTLCVLCGPDARFFSFSPLWCAFALFALWRDPAPDALPDAGGAGLPEPPEADSGNRKGELP